jgi:Immunity protein 40
MKTRKEIFEKYKNFGISLSEINPGSQEIAFPAHAAIKVINEFKDNGISILGGDVMKHAEGKITYAELNWFINKELQETQEDFLRRSIKYSLDYINRFPANSHYFVIVSDYQ